MNLPIEENPETQLLESYYIHSGLSIQVLCLNDTYYLLEKNKGKKGELYPVESVLLQNKLKAGSCTKTDILDELPPAKVNPKLTGGVDFTIGDGDPLVHKLSQAMAEFAQNNPSALSAIPSHFEAYQEQERGNTPIVDLPQPSPEPEPPEPELPPVFYKTYPVVESALQEATEQQQKHLHKAQAFQEKIEKKLLEWQSIVHQKEALIATFQGLQDLLENFESQIDSGEFQEAQLLKKANSDLEELQEQLSHVLIESSAAQAFFQAHQEHKGLQREVLNDLNQTIQKVTQYRRLVQHMIQQLHYQSLAEQRKAHLLERKAELEPMIAHLEESVAQLEAVNQDILMLDPLAVPEPPPILVLHELKRLKFEMDILLADPALKETSL